MTGFERGAAGILFGVAMARLVTDLYKVVTNTLTNEDLPFVWGLAMIALVAMFVITMTPSLLERVMTNNPPPPILEEVPPEWSCFHPKNLPTGRRDAPDGTSD